MNLRGDTSKEYLFKQQESYHSILRSKKRNEMLYKKRIEKENNKLGKEAYFIKKETLYELIKQIKQLPSKIILIEKMIFIRHLIQESIKLSDIQQEEFIQLYGNLINYKDTNVVILVIETLTDLVLISDDYSLLIDKYHIIQTLQQNLIDTELFIPCLTFIGNLTIDNISTAIQLAPSLIQQSMNINNQEIIRCASWLIHVCSTKNETIKQFIIPFISIPDQKIQKQILKACIERSQHNLDIPLDIIIPFISNEWSRKYVIEILSHQSFYNNYLDQIYSLLPYLLSIHLQPQEITDLIWLIENVSLNNINYLIKLGEIGCIDFVIKHSYSTNTAVKRDCCHTLSSFIVLCQNEQKMLKILVEHHIVEALIDLIKQYRLIEIEDLSLLIESLLILIKMDESKTDIITLIEDNIQYIEIILFDSSTPTKICKKIKWLLDTYFN
ncbi:hypothetical protein EHI8A_106650 [Entamoeba histolytica HM-1:IMSS-B]|uniref:Importin alpha n=6 Tax=Entamoeba histolytica TaxID=5759 RepID=C4LW99_ENTH1|nr:hypothetical protein EHI_155480 [Entamoeba histolytica HM-1:IMSS]EMD49736.1 Hypothetical protein EHI5A_059310 [Entamoeba histolytica KU27]EMH77679.1 hypothetical protein EHI8A_106650 [Entamoeba histolytica HM-1:IMSS-B]ENY61323.1 hypothetical protein EHI7A_099970 [Entamoeba histolytica HM-1:IMSS-A]GAT92978.1 hypothetical protein CL6EHI_155480 [Entamoeba histolytica]EAL50352.2 hypothetical protein EHI_155480 [Entamoeba histolytica HM-1:IMSS]|eukprot:XP_655736.2 hypothetical protein EHI_155480 [Entamoeba histolytica HM-1:IMSS]